MKTSLAFVRRSQAFASRVLSSHLPVQRQNVIATNAFARRYFSAEPAVASVHENLVKDAIKKMIATRDNLISKPITDNELESRFRNCQNLFKEAELCIADLKEAAGDSFEEECRCATGAVEKAFGAYVDLLEDLRRANEQQLQLYSDERLRYPSSLKKLRQDLSTLCKT